MLQFIKYTFSILILLVIPTLTFAYFEDLDSALSSLLDVVNSLIILAYALAFLGLVWGVAVYIFKAGDEDAHEQGRRIMIGGIIGLFVITAVWALVAFITKSVGLDATTTGTIPTIKKA